MEAQDFIDIAIRHTLKGLDLLIYTLNEKNHSALHILDKEKKMLWRVSLSENYINKKLSKLSLESSKENFLNLLSTALEHSDFDIKKTNKRLEIILRYQIVEGLFLKGQIELDLVLDGNKQPDKFSDHLLDALKNFFMKKSALYKNRTSEKEKCREQDIEGTSESSTLNSTTSEDHSMDATNYIVTKETGKKIRLGYFKHQFKQKRVHGVRLIDEGFF